MNKKPKENMNTYIFPTDDDMPKSEAWTYSLLLDHPFFIDNVKKIREKLNIKENGFASQFEYYNWRAKNNQEHKEIHNEAEDLINQFKIETKLSRRIIPIITDYITCPDSIIPFLLKVDNKDKRKFTTGKSLKKTPGVGMIIADKDREINKYRFIPGNIYLEIYPETTIRDVLNIFKLINKKRDKRNKKKIEVSQRETISKDVWDLHKQLKTDDEISSLINEKYGTEFRYNDVCVYRKRYKDALMDLKRF